MYTDKYSKVSIIILNWNGWKDTVECLESLYQITYPNYDVIIVDNGSKDNSIQKIKEYCKGKIKIDSEFFSYNPNNKPIYVLEYVKEEAEKGGDSKKEKYFSKLPSNRKLRLILNDKNYGFAEGNNIGIRYALKVLNPEYILLLNNDTVVDPHFLTELVKIAKSDKRIGSVQPLLLKKQIGKNIIDSLGMVISKFGKISDSGMGKVLPNAKLPKVLKIFGTCAACSLYKSEIFRKYLLDSRFFYIFEDADLNFKMRIDGLDSYIVTSAKVYHARGISGKKDNINIFLIYHARKNQFSLFLRYYNLQHLILALPNFFTSFSLAFIASIILTLKYKNIEYLITLLKLWRDSISKRKVCKDLDYFLDYDPYKEILNPSIKPLK